MIFLKVSLFTILIVSSFVIVSHSITKLTGEKRMSSAKIGVNPEAGKDIFWGKGKCGTCHSIGGEGSAIRCPDLANIGVKAGERTPGMSVTQYLVESIATPGTYVVQGYKNEMPVVYEPPILLKPDEIKAVITFLQSQGSEVDIAGIKLPKEILEAQVRRTQEVWKPYIIGDMVEGERLFFDVQGKAGCTKCHTVKGKGGSVGPDLTNIAGTRRPEFIIESILNPNLEIASGFEQYLVVTHDGQYLTGVIKKEDDTILEMIVDEEGRPVQKVIQKSEIDAKEAQKTSMMPGNLSQILTIKEFHDILGYLIELK